MKIFTDFHHDGLLYSLKLLFEDRLGGELYSPIGLDWFHKGYWAIARPYGDNLDTVKQYLDLERFVPPDGTRVLNDIAKQEETHYLIPDHGHNYLRKAITFEQFQEMDIDIIIASIPAHWELYRQMRDIYKPKAKLICQMGNMFYEVEEMMRAGIIKNLMSSTIGFETPPWVNAVFYHQEIDLHVFQYKDPLPETRHIVSFVNLLPKEELFNKYRDFLPAYIFLAYGSSTPIGVINSINEIADIMGTAQFAWHIKPYGDGFGHILYDWAHIGRPIITNFSDYKDKLGGELLTDGVTAIDLETRSFEKNLEKIRELSAPENYIKMCEAMKKRVRECVNYGQEEVKIREFLENLR